MSPVKETATVYKVIRIAAEGLLSAAIEHPNFRIVYVPGELVKSRYPLFAASTLYLAREWLRMIGLVHAFEKVEGRRSEMPSLDIWQAEATIVRPATHCLEPASIAPTNPNAARMLERFWTGDYNGYPIALRTMLCDTITLTRRITTRPR